MHGKRLAYKQALASLPFPLLFHKIPEAIRVPEDKARGALNITHDYDRVVGKRRGRQVVVVGVEVGSIDGSGSYQNRWGLPLLAGGAVG